MNRASAKAFLHGGAIQGRNRARPWFHGDATLLRAIFGKQAEQRFGPAVEHHHAGAGAGLEGNDG
jgi:hypothetical protein